MPSRLQFRRDPAATWTANNPVLALSEPGEESDTHYFKIGDGVTAWNSLPYATHPDLVAATANPTGNTIMRRRADGGVDVAGLYFSAAQAAETWSATRKDYSDGNDRWTPVFKTGAAYTFALTDEFKHILSNDSVAQTYTVPTNATVAFPIGARIRLTRWTSAALTLTQAAGVSIVGSTSVRTFDFQYASLTLIKVATDTWFITDFVEGYGTNAATPYALARRDVNGWMSAVGVSATEFTISAATPGAADRATRKDYVDARDRWTPVLKTGATYTFALTDETNHILSNDTIAQTYTVPTNATAAFPLGTKIQVTRWAGGTLTLAPAAGVTLNSVNANRALNQYESCMLVKVATDTWLIVDLATTATETVAGNVELATAAEATTGADNTRAVHPAGMKAALDAALGGTPFVIQHDGTTVANRPATTRPVQWFVPFAFSLPLTGTTAGGTKAAVDNLDLISRY